MIDWKSEKLAKTYLEGVRAAIPFAKEQIEILIRIVRFFKPDIKSFLDLGSGDGILGRNIFSNWPESKGVFLDLSDTMIHEAKLKCKDYPNSSSFVVQDFGDEDWIKSFSDLYTCRPGHFRFCNLPPGQ